MPIVKEIPELTTLGNVVPDGYEYHEKIVKPKEDLSLSNAYLKWYNLYPDDSPIIEKQEDISRTFLRSEVEANRLKLEGEPGFVILHRAGSALLLLLTVWRRTNEMWEVVYMKNADDDGNYYEITFENIPRATYCVWELGPVWHERNAWVHFLSSQRDEAAKLQFVNDRFEGRV